MVREDLIQHRRERAEAVTPAQVGREAIYRDRPILMIVRIETIQDSEEGLRARMVPGAAPGIPLVEDPPPWDIGGPWDIVSVAGRKWYAMYLNWTVCSVLPRVLVEDPSADIRLAYIPGCRRTGRPDPGGSSSSAARPQCRGRRNRGRRPSSGRSPRLRRRPGN
jgi:hypothetical protein